MKTGFAFALLLGASVAQAAGLGKLTVNSALGQPLNAEIDLVSVQAGELDQLTARVAPPEAFRDARIEYSSSLRQLRFSIDKRPNGQPYIKVTSVGPINEPFVDALIEVSWPQGRIQREYPILLDPPGYNQSRVAPPTTAAAPPSRAAETPPASAPAASSQTAAPATAPAPSAPSAAASGTGTPSASAELSRPAAAPTASGDTYGPVQKGDTLRKIAEEVKPTNVSLEQMLVALYRENKSAFVNNNMNRLKAGQILKVPSADQVSGLERKEVTEEIRTHVADWRAYREQLAGGVGSIAPRAETSGSASGRIASAAVTPPAPPAAEPKDVLKLSKSTSTPGKAAAGKGSAADRATALQEELTAKEKALAESQSRVADLEKQIRDMQRLIELKGGAPGKTDSKVAAVPPPPAATAKVEPPKTAPAPAPAPSKAPDTKTADASKATTPAAPAKAPEPAKVEPPKVAEAPKSEPPKAAEAPKTEPPKTAEAPKVAEAPKPAPPKAAAPKTPPKKAPPAEKSFTDELMDNPAYLAGGLGLLAIGVGGFMFMRRRKRKALEEGTSSSLGSSAFPSDLKVDDTAGKSGGGLVDTGNSSFLTDFDKTGPGSIDTDEVDPVAEAEVYIAYGRDTQAEEILKEAMARDSSRPEIALKLLEIYHARKSATAFEGVAKQLHDSVGDSHPMWHKAAAMGAQIDPNNSLYGSAAGADSATYAAAAPAPAAKPNLDFDVLGSSGAAAAPAPDFDLDSDTSKGEAPAAGLDFDITPSASETATHAAAQAEPAKDEKPSFDFDLSGLDFPSSKPAGSTDLEVDPTTTRPSTSSAPSMDLADLSLDMPGSSDAAGGGGGGGGGGGSEAVGTKLELAKAYLEIGDKDGAREILQEVANEGSSAQKEEAQKLISQL
ncbi:MAG TPA: FimV/HubP family polar landmark protein [Usitatibacter sp.]|nr:FimV/HubP family polar landmark protein [Usitatibacter sp.]